jgi:SAM-dependent methyltransferase
MHPSAYENFDFFVKNYLSLLPNENHISVIDIGSQDVNGSLRPLVPVNMKYIGVDFVPGKNVDLILQDPYSLPLESNSVDVVISSSCFEHSEMFWVLFLEIARILKPGGLFYLNAPSNGLFHQFPVDCWRFYPDSAQALCTWAKRNNMEIELLESYISNQKSQQVVGHLSWNDFVAVFVKGKKYVNNFPNRIIHNRNDFSNGKIFGRLEFFNSYELSEDQRLRNR